VHIKERSFGNHLAKFKRSSLFFLGGSPPVFYGHTQLNSLSISILRSR